MVYKDSTKTREQQSMDRGQNPYAEGSRYYDLWESNPYTMDKMTQQQTGWDRLANMFGFRSAYDTAVDQRMQAAREYDAQIAQIKGEDEYNSPQAQAAREKAAGLNPDLVGVEGGGTASEFAMEQTTPEVTPDENLAKIGGIMNAAAQAITMACGLNDSIISTIGAATTLTGQKINNLKGMEELAQGFWETWTPDFMQDENGKKANEGELHLALIQHAKLWAKQNHLNKQQTKHFVEGVSRRFDNDKSRMYDKWTTNEKSRQNYGLTAGTKYNTEDKEIDDIIETMAPLSKLYEKYLYNSAYFHAEQAQNNAEYEQEYDAKQDARATNAENKRAEQQSQLEEDERKAKAQVMHSLTQKAEEGSKLAFFLSLALPIAWNMAENTRIGGGRKTKDSTFNWTM